MSWMNWKRFIFSSLTIDEGWTSKTEGFKQHLAEMHKAASGVVWMTLSYRAQKQHLAMELREILLHICRLFPPIFTNVTSHYIVKDDLQYGSWHQGGWVLDTVLFKTWHFRKMTDIWKQYQLNFPFCPMQKSCKPLDLFPVTCLIA